ncbi:unnamed protein product [Urochloa decumbens]|uniref:NB-ARC domain-containing protein n=1 Tax=Urochloa decumbens TaxID=240449 RepID=A0ABC9FLZ4_9POAL
MDTILSAVLSELSTRSIHFFISKISKPVPLDVEDCLRRVLLRAQVIMDEAMGRHITNQAMLLQLVELRDAMHRGYYMIDTFRYQHHDEEETKDEDVSRTPSLSIVNYVKHLRFSSRGGLALKELQEAHDNLSSMILDVNELVLFLTSYPRLYRQPYSIHLQLANCMFGREMEAQLVINFLLHTDRHEGEDLGLLPIVGPGQVGKTTLVAHVCKNERVRGHFSKILFFSIHSFTNDEVSNFEKACATEHQNHMSNSNIDRRLLVVVEFIGDLNENAWNRIYRASKQYVPSGSKIIVTSRSDEIVKFGTTRALTLKYLSHESYWYFFKTITFGSTDPKMHPRLTQLAMLIAKMLNSSLIAGNITACLLRDNFDVHFWGKVLTFFRGYFQRHISRFGEHPIDLICQNKPAHVARMTIPSEEFMVQHQNECSLEEEVPQITFKDVMFGSVKPHEKFEVLTWKARIPPYYSRVYTCEIQKLNTTASKRKRSTKNGSTLC